MKMKKILIFLFFFLSFCINVFAYDTFPTAALKCDVKKMEIGQTIRADIYITVPPFIELLKQEKDIYINGWEIQDFVFKKDIRDDSKYILNLFITTFDSKINRIPAVRLSFVNKNEEISSALNEEKFYFFSNSIPIHIDSIVQKYNNSTIFDIKKMKSLPIPIMFYILCFLFLLFVIFVVYRSVLDMKIERSMKISLSPKEKALQKINNILNIDYFDADNVKEYCYLMSEALKSFILDELKIKNTEMTTKEVVSVISDKDSLLYDLSPQIIYLFKVYDDVKFSAAFLDKRNFFDTYNKTKGFIKNLDINNGEC